LTLFTNSVIIKSMKKLNKKNYKRIDGRVNKCEWTYLAGIIDGEGSISCPEYKTLYLAIVNTDRKLIDWLLETLGGTVFTTKHQGTRWKDGYRWSLFGLDAQRILRKVEPYLIIKKERARLALQLPINRKGVGLSLEDKEKRGEIVNKLKALNRRGK